MFRRYRSKMIPGGYYIKARCIKYSWIAHAQPIIREVWDYLLREANHEDKKYNGFEVKRGQLFRSYREIRNDLSWKIGFRVSRYHESSMKRAMKALMNERMIELMSEPRGNLITILNYDKFQNPENYERTNERTNCEPMNEPIANRHRSAINKNDNNLRIKEDVINITSLSNCNENTSKSNLKYSSEIEEIFQYWKDTLEHPKGRIDEKRKIKIRSALKSGYSVDDIKLAIDGCLASPYHQGENKNNAVYDSLELICRDSEHIDRFIKLSKEPNAKLLSAKGRQARQNGQTWLHMRQQKRESQKNE